MKPTMKDIAESLGVSRTTVSLVLKGDGDKYNISKNTQKIIMRKVKELNYRPNYFASALNLKRSNIIGVILPNVFEIYMNEIIHGIEDILYENSYNMTLCTSRFSTGLEKRNIDHLKSFVDGFLIAFNAPFSDTEYDYSHLHELVKEQHPVVFIDRYLPELNSAYVVQDDFYGAYQATQCLVEKGCRNIGYISFDLAITSIQDRYRGYCEALKDQKLSIHQDHIILLKQQNNQSNDLRAALKTCLERPDKPDAFFVTTNGIALKASFILKQRGHSVPMARFGMDPNYFTSKMILVEQPHMTIGKKAAQMLLDQISGQSGTAGKEMQQRIKPRIIDKITHS
ncbi:MAG: LacI family DNA-binding transcriptional regulator [candidate division KSB1 bacterium]|nr:LacI family DNA-binding transcriptional regulator [candidate division KSB1 bacterium]